MAKKVQAPTGFYTATEAMRRLGLKRGTFFYHVKTDKIKKYTPPGAAEGFYSKREIDRIAQARELFLLTYSLAPKTYEKASEEDIRGIYDLCIALYGIDGTPTYETRLAIWQKNPDVYYVVKQEGIVVGYISLIWFTDEALQYLMSPTPPQPRISKAGTGVYSITGADNVRPFIPGQPIDNLFISLAVRPGLTNEQQRRYGFRLLRDTLEVLKDFADRGMPISKLYATSERTDGIKLAHDLGMREIKYPGDPLLRFDMDLTTSECPLAEEYREYTRQSLGDRALPAPQPAPIISQPVPQKLYHYKTDREEAEQKSVKPAATAKPRAGPRPSSSSTGDMPAHLVGFTDFYMRHGISESTARRAMTSGKFPYTPGEWHRPNAVIKQALDAEQQRAFCQHFQRKGKLHQCDDPGCPCHQ